MTIKNTGFGSFLLLLERNLTFVTLFLKLSEREQEVLFQRIGYGHKLKDVARRLGCSIQTVKNIQDAALKKVTEVDDDLSS